MKVVAVVLLSFVALTALGQDMAGNYVLRGVMEVGSELLLKPDGKFEFMLAYGAADYWAKGTWSRDGAAVVLHSVGKEEAPFRLLRSEAGKPGQIRVVVLGQNDKGVENIDVHLLIAGKALNGRTDSDGAAVFPDDPKAHAVAFEVPVYEVQAGPYEIDPTKKDFYFEINGDAITQVFFKDERLAIDGTTLVMKHGDPKDPMRYVKE
ncbi:MAG: hypothetical protein ACLPPV_21660 [Candidatus Korobacteraceae bacterium]|jgi:hypothetical protein